MIHTNTRFENKSQFEPFVWSRAFVWPRISLGTLSAFEALSGQREEMARAQNSQAFMFQCMVEIAGQLSSFEWRVTSRWEGGRIKASRFGNKGIHSHTRKNIYAIQLGSQSRRYKTHKFWRNWTIFSPVSKFSFEFIFNHPSRIHFSYRIDNRCWSISNVKYVKCDMRAWEKKWHHTFFLSWVAEFFFFKFGGRVFL